ncbi:MAG TPA: hypothetical protein VNJ05_01470 [Sphingomicrobium sp.]|nr:hypothetical protein [Sphingomicrobium sp.]
MRRMSLIALSVALLVTTGAAAKTGSPAKPAPATSGKTESSERKICKWLETTGTQKEERVCLTKAECKKAEEMR